MMKKIEAPSLEEAYNKASIEFGCSITELTYEIVQYPTTGMLGLFKKNAIIVAIKKGVETQAEIIEYTQSVKKETAILNHEENISETLIPKEKPQEVQTIEIAKIEEKVVIEEVKEKDIVVDSFFNTVKKETPALKQPKKEEYVKHTKVNNFGDDREEPRNKQMAIDIENQIKFLMSKSCFNIDTIEVDVFNSIAHIFIDGEDAALLIGKEGYRYNALSYMFFNWINPKYNLYVKLEIAEFVQSQQEMIRSYLQPFIESVKSEGKGKTKPLDGILVQIALEQLRLQFPNKYVAIKTGKDNKKFVIVNNFLTKLNG